MSPAGSHRKLERSGISRRPCAMRIRRSKADPVGRDEGARGFAARANGAPGLLLLDHLGDTGTAFKGALRSLRGTGVGILLVADVDQPRDHARVRALGLTHREIELPRLHGRTLRALLEKLLGAHELPQPGARRGSSRARRGGRRSARASDLVRGGAATRTRVARRAAALQLAPHRGCHLGFGDLSKAHPRDRASSRPLVSENQARAVLTGFSEMDRLLAEMRSLLTTEDETCSGTRIVQ